MIKVLFICHGNICRSPMAQFIFEEAARQKGIAVLAESKAVSREELGNPVYPPARRVLEARGIPLRPHRAEQIAARDYEDFDHIVIMEEANRRRMQIPPFATGKVRRLLDFTSSPGDIEDPWYTGSFEKVFEQISAGCKALLEQVCS